MGLLSHLTHPKGKIWIALDKGTFQEGEPVAGKIHVEAEEYIPSIGLKVEARVVESWNEMVWVTLPNNQRIQENQRRTNNLYQRDVQVAGATDFGKGPAREFPFSVGIPPCRATRGGSSVQNLLKAVLQVKGRPDMTNETQIAFVPAGAYGSMPMNVGYGPGPMPAGYGPNPGYQPNPGYGVPPMNQGYQGYQGYGQPGYGVPPPQQQAPSVKVRCKYCTGLMDANAPNCPTCGAHQ